MMQRIQLESARWLAACVAVLAGCGDDGGPSPADPDGSIDFGPKFALTTQVFAADATNDQSYILVADELAGDIMLSLDDAIEVPGRAIGAGPDGGGVVFVAGNADPNVTRYDLQPDGTLRRGETVSFLNMGIATIGEYGGQFQFISDTKAYFFDGPTAQVVIWNPRDMTITGRIPLDELVLPNALLTYSAVPVRRGDDVIMFAAWRQGLEVPSQTAVVVIDSTTDQATIAIDDRCGYVRDGIEASDGMIYLATEAFASAVHRLNPANAPAPCMLRFDPDTGQFDPDFHIELATLVGGDTAGMLIAGPGNEAFVRVLDETAFEIMPDTNPRVLASASAWRWARVTLGDMPSAEPIDAGPHSGSVVMLPLGDRRLVPLFQGRDATQLIELTADGPGDVALTTPGLVFSAVRMQ